MKKDDYYHNCSIPKPMTRKREHKTNGYKNKAQRYCYYCKTPYAERHEVFPGKNRQISIDEGFQVDLCRECHSEMQGNVTERAKVRNKYWKQFYQNKYENKLIESGIAAEDARKLWISLIGRSYVDE